MKTRAIAVLPLALLALGCSPGLADARSAVNASSAAYESARADAEARYEREQRSCLAEAQPEPCVARVRADWVPARAAVEALRRAVAVAQTLVRGAEASEALGRPPNIPRLLAAAGAALDAGEALAAELLRLDAPAPGRARP